MVVDLHGNDCVKSDKSTSEAPSVQIRNTEEKQINASSLHSISNVRSNSNYKNKKSHRNNRREGSKKSNDKTKEVDGSLIKSKHPQREKKSQHDVRKKQHVNNLQIKENKSKKPTALVSSQFKANGEKGAGSHTVEESFRIELKDILLKFRDDEGIDSLEFSSNLSNTERKYVHELSSQLGLKSKSQGKEENRCITVKKKTDEINANVKHDGALPVLHIGERGSNALFQYMKQYPKIKANGIDLLNIDQSHILNEKNAVRNGPLVKSRIKLKKPTIPYEISKQRIKQNRNSQTTLPIENWKDEILKSIQKNVVTFVISDTGGGKSTKIPQFLLNSNPANANILVTQPRRISAISLAERIAWEIGEDGVGHTVGYTIRFQSKFSADRTRIQFVTPGIALNRIETLASYTHIVLDEIHERDQYTEFLIMILRLKLEKKLLPNTKLIMMSATVPDLDILLQYWREVIARVDDERLSVGVVTVPGRTHSVQEYYLEDILGMIGWGGEEYCGNSTTEQHFAHDTRASTSSAVYTCVLCGKSNFFTAEDLGAHVALCGIAVPVRQEKHVDGKTRNSDTLSSLMKNGEYNDELSYTADIETEKLIMKNSGENTNDFQETVGPSVDKSSSLNPIPSQEELLSQYQRMRNDEFIDYDLVLDLLRYILKSSACNEAILVFFPGWNEILSLENLLKTSSPFNANKESFVILLLHSGVTSKDQQKVFRSVPSGVRKIVLTTNIAETSITIDDVSFVVDVGKAKEKNYDPHIKTSTLETVWISQASAKQRKGRAGRTRPGVCFRLYSKRRYASFRPNVQSELLRTTLESVVLQCKKLDLAPSTMKVAENLSAYSGNGISAFLSTAVTPPHPKSIENAMDILIAIGAMKDNKEHDLTALGQCLAQMSLEPRVGKMVLWSYLLRCSQTILDCAAIMSTKTPFLLPTSSDNGTARKHLHGQINNGVRSVRNTSKSDLTPVLHVLSQKGKKGFEKLCLSHNLNHQTMNSILNLRKNLQKEVMSLGISTIEGQLKYTEEGRNLNNRSCGEQGDYLEDNLLEAAITAGFYPNVAYRTMGETNYRTYDGSKARIHNSSVNNLTGSAKKCKTVIEFIVYGEIVRSGCYASNQFTINQTTQLKSPIPLLLFCGKKLRSRPSDFSDDMVVINVDDAGWSSFLSPSLVASGLILLRERVEDAFGHIIEHAASSNKGGKLKKEDILEMHKNTVATLIEVLSSVTL